MKYLACILCVLLLGLRGITIGFQLESPSLTPILLVATFIASILSIKWSGLFNINLFSPLLFNLFLIFNTGNPSVASTFASLSVLYTFALSLWTNQTFLFFVKSLLVFTFVESTCKVASAILFYMSNGSLNSIRLASFGLPFYLIGAVYAVTTILCLWSILFLLKVPLNISRPLKVLLISLLSLNILLSGSKTGLLCLLLLLAIHSLGSRRVFLLSFFLLPILFFTQTLITILARFLPREENSYIFDFTHSRGGLWIQSLHHTLNQQSFIESLFGSFQRFEICLYPECYSYPHNLLIEILHNFGHVGLLLAIPLLIMPLFFSPSPVSFLPFRLLYIITLTLSLTTFELAKDLSLFLSISLLYIPRLSPRYFTNTRTR